MLRRASPSAGVRLRCCAVSTRSARRFYVVLAAITAAALAWRVGYVLWWHFHSVFGARTKLNGDAAYYHWQANDIASGRWFIDPGQYKFFGRVTPSAGHPPNYLLFLAFVSKFIGTSVTTHRLASTLLGAAAVFLLGMLARRLFDSDWAGWIAAGLAAAYANLWINDEMLMSEGMYFLTVAVMVLLAYSFWRRPCTANALLMGLGVGLATNSRAEAGALFVLLAVPFALLTRDVALRTRWKHALLACVAGGLVLLPWVAYNATRFDHPVAMSNGIGSVLLVANCDFHNADGSSGSTYSGTYAGYWNQHCAAGLSDKIDGYFPLARAKYLHDELGLVPGTDFHFFGDESTHEVAWRAIGLHEMRDHASLLPKVVAIRVARMWELYPLSLQNIRFNDSLEGRGCEMFVQPDGQVTIRSCWQSKLATIQYFPLLALSIVGLVVLRRRRVPILPFFAIAAAVTITAAMTFGITRYRAPIDAMLPVLAAGAIVAIAARIARRRSPPNATAHPS
jgi:4-amino-4-deoxy-L-arabinose transferase-like glycosyltransferase